MIPWDNRIWCDQLIYWYQWGSVITNVCVRSVLLLKKYRLGNDFTIVDEFCPTNKVGFVNSLVVLHRGIPVRETD